MNENSIFFALDKIEDKYIEEAAESAMKESAVQPLFVTPDFKKGKKTKKPIFAIASIAACFVLIFGVCIAVSRNSGIDITQTPPPLNTANTQTTSAEITNSNEIIRPSLENNMVTSAPTVEANDNTVIAVDFIHDFYATLSTHDESVLNLDKYFNDGDLKDRMAECKNKLLKNNDFYEKENFAIDYAAAVSDKRIDGDVHQITVAYVYNYLTKPYDYENPQNNDWAGSGMNAAFAVKDGKILNFAVENYFEALSPNENVPEVQIIRTHITNVFSDSGTRVFDLDGISYECDPDVKTYDCISEEGGYLKIITPEGNIDLRDYQGDSDEVIDMLNKIYLLGIVDTLGNTGRVSANGISFTDALLYRTENNKLLMLGKAPEKCPAGCDPENYRVAVLLQPQSTPADTSIPDTTTSQTDAKTPMDTVTEDGVPIKSKIAFTENEEAEILRAYKHLKTYFDEYLSADYPNAGQYITSIDDVRYADDLYSTRYSDTPEFKPEKEIEFWVTCSDNEVLSSSYNNEWYRVSIFNNQWTTYTEYKLNRKTPIDTVANDGVPIKSKAGFTEKEKADILEAYEALKVYIDNLNINYPNGSQYIVSVDDVRHAGGNFHDARPGATDYRPSNVYEFWITCDYEPLSSSYKNEWFMVSKSNDGWTA